MPAKIVIITIAGRPLTLSRPIADYAAARLEKILPQLVALNAAGKSQSDAADALGTTVSSLRTWLDLTGVVWATIARRGNYAARK